MTFKIYNKKIISIIKYINKKYYNYKMNLLMIIIKH